MLSNFDFPPAADFSTDISTRLGAVNVLPIAESIDQSIINFRFDAEYQIIIKI